MPVDKVRDLLASAAIGVSGRGQKLKDSMIKRASKTSIITIERECHDDDDDPTQIFLPMEQLPIID
jgi:hypothetical protein